MPLGLVKSKISYRYEKIDDHVVFCYILIYSVGIPPGQGA